MIGELEVKNRIIQAPFCTRFATRDGEVTERMINYYSERAKGGTGLIIVEFAYVDDKASQSIACQLGIYDDHCIPGLSRLAETIKNLGARVGIQIAHAGRAKSVAGPVVAPSRVPRTSLTALKGMKGQIPKELSVEEIQEIVEAFGEAANRAKKAGFELVEIHGAHGYLISQFLSPRTNRRNDCYGGSLEDRMRFPLEVLASIREKVGSSFPVGIRISADEYMENGITVEESRIFSRRLESAGVDYIHVSAGAYETLETCIQPMYLPTGFNVHLAEAIKKTVEIPVVASGSITTPELAESILAEGKADFISLGRPLVADPYFAKKAFEGRSEDIRVCIRCNECFRRTNLNRSVTCTVNPAVGEKFEGYLEPASRRKKICVVGGGPAGMEAARVAALRGHEVTLYEKRELGGLLLEASIPEFKKDLRLLLEHMKIQLKKLNVKIVRKEATAELIERSGCEIVIVATGATPLIPNIKGVNRSNVITALDALNGKETGQDIIVVGGGLVGLETALFLAEQGKKVKIVSRRPMEEIGADIEPLALEVLKRRLNKYDVKIYAGLVVEEITDQGLIAKDMYENRVEINGETIILARGFKPEKRIVSSLREKGLTVYAVGDCVNPRTLYEAIHEGYFAGLKV
ncbi:MAG: NADH oxidase [Candidatus Hecatellales archaeon]|nr:MAG: NADH oxidase [Candidatus Hecatellales archaeon]